MPGVLCQSGTTASVNKTSDSKMAICNCDNCPCRRGSNKRLLHHKKETSPGCIAFQLPRYKEPVSDTYSHSVYKKEFCNKTLIRQLKEAAHLKAGQRHQPLPPRLENERFTFKTMTETDYRRYTLREEAACKAKFPRNKRKEDFYYKPGEYVNEKKFSAQSLSHEDYCPKKPIPTYYRPEQDCILPPFEGASCYFTDYKPHHPSAYMQSRKYKKRVKFD
ncbi:uncharacterized protein LOC118193781 [Stegodyphus dumicola]|uniref:uncharacterized protein LOC118193781 n=1 Tax=Stegodyphus dumicola TaxID=202533 RepID=UPI0015AB5275|nr:uncharacterized protein LOC118193781 [Stegodyphus dumicola]XP_035220812.1 uncharacterized protein LOC118193781 [Stegodyphus dumicola]